MISLTIIITGLSIAIMFMGTSAYRNNELFYVMNYSFSIVPTESMIGNASDSLEPGDMVIIKNTSFDDVVVGDVIVFQDQVNINGSPNNILIIHRVIDINTDGSLVTKGDNPINQIDPNPVTASTFQGSYYAKITFMKPIVSLMISSRSLVFMGLFAVLVSLVIWELAHIYKTISEAKKEEIKKKHLEEIEELKAVEREKIKQQILEENMSKKTTDK